MSWPSFLYFLLMSQSVILMGMVISCSYIVLLSFSNKKVGILL